MQRKEIPSAIDLKVKKINNANALKEEDILGFDIGKYPNYHLFAVAPTYSGKTTALLTFIRKIMNKDTIVHLFCHSVNSDANWLWFQDYMKKKKRILNIYEDLSVDLPMLIEAFKNEAKELKLKKDELEQLTSNKKGESSEVVSVDISRPVDLFTIVGSSEDDKEIKVRIKMLKEELKTDNKKIANKHIIIFDDISREIAKNEYYTELLKEGRHFGARILTSSQNGLDIAPSCRMQIKILLLFGNIPKTKLQQVYNSIPTIDLTFDEFLKYYKEATKNRYEFLTMYIPEQEYRCCFDKLLIED